MAIIKKLKGDMPIIGERAFLAETATIIGTVTMGDDCSIWYGAVLRGDVGAIRIGDRVNIQDNAVLHATYQKSECIIGNDVSIGHGANVHGCIIGNDVIIGMGAIVMDNTVVPGPSLPQERSYLLIRLLNRASGQESLPGRSRTVRKLSAKRPTPMPTTI